MLQNFDFLFPELQDDEANLLPRSATTVKRLKELCRAVVDPGPVTGDGKVPAIYTYPNVLATGLELVIVKR